MLIAVLELICLSIFKLVCTWLLPHPALPVHLHLHDLLGVCAAGGALGGRGIWMGGRGSGAWEAFG